MIADRSREPGDLATKTDLQEIKADLYRWTRLCFIVLLIGVYGLFAAVVISLIVRG